jgi:hypothetical protein
MDAAVPAQPLDFLTVAWLARQRRTATTREYFPSIELWPAQTIFRGRWPGLLEHTSGVGPGLTEPTIRRRAREQLYAPVNHTLIR